MIARARSVGATSVCALGLFLAVGHAPASAQSDGSPSDGGGPLRWTLLDAVGYGGLGFALGLAAAWDMEGPGFGPPDAALALIGATTAAGAVSGGLLGRRAASSIARRGHVGGAHGVATIAGAVMAGGTLGALAAVPPIEGQGEGTVLGTDEQTVVVLVLAGGVLGSLFVWKHRADFTARTMSVEPALMGAKRYGLLYRVGF